MRRSLRVKRLWLVAVDYYVDLVEKGKSKKGEKGFSTSWRVCWWFICRLIAAGQGSQVDEYQ
jgi:hypothetical protein